MSANAPAAADYRSQIAGQQPLMQGLLGQAGQAWSSPLNNGQQARDQASGAMYSQATSRLDPQWAMKQQQLTGQLAAQGLDPTSEAAKSAQNTFGQQRNDAYNQADYSSQILGGNAAQQAQQMDINGRMAPLQAYQGLLGGQLGLQGQQYGEAANNAQMQNQFWGGIAAGGLGLLGAGAKAFAGGGG